MRSHLADFWNPWKYFLQTLTQSVDILFDSCILCTYNNNIYSLHTYTHANEKVLNCFEALLELLLFWSALSYDCYRCLARYLTHPSYPLPYSSAFNIPCKCWPRMNIIQNHTSFLHTNLQKLFSYMCISLLSRLWRLSL